jgi:hypothetical protein
VIRRLVVVGLVGMLGACAPREPVALAIRARGGPLAGIVREVEADVRAGAPGTWRWRTVFRAPDHYAWKIYTADEPNDVLFDGADVRTWVAGRLVASEAGATAAFRTHARFTAVMNLDALQLPGVAVAPLPPSAVPAGAASGLVAVFADDGSRYRLGFDAAMRLVALEGPLSLPPIGSGRLEARFADFRQVGRWVLPYTTEYRLAGTALAAERTLVACPDPPGLAEADFATPATLPGCPGS